MDDHLASFPEDLLVEGYCFAGGEMGLMFLGVGQHGGIVAIGHVVNYVGFGGVGIAFLPSLRPVVAEDVIFEGVLGEGGGTCGK